MPIYSATISSQVAMVAPAESTLRNNAEQDTIHKDVHCALRMENTIGFNQAPMETWKRRNVRDI